MVYRVLGRLLWRGRLGEAEVVILHRGAPQDRKTIPGSRIVSVRKSCFVYKDGGGRETTIPLHRVLEVRLKGKAEWKRKEKP
jgi:uncharacterized protein (UPF0248 family)